MSSDQIQPTEWPSPDREAAFQQHLCDETHQVAPLLSSWSAQHTPVRLSPEVSASQRLKPGNKLIRGHAKYLWLSKQNPWYMKLSSIGQKHPETSAGAAPST
jgi:hypothetical protein